MYEKLSSDKFECPNNCGHEFSRSPEDFFALLVSTRISSVADCLQPDFPAYVSHLEKHLQRVCPKCDIKVCSACEDPVREASPEKSATPDGRGSESKALFHCPTIQGAILGVALHMIEQEFGSQLRIDKPVSVPPTKKRKTSALTKLLNSMQGGEDDDSDSDGDYGIARFGGSRGQAAPRGTGYSGGSREDVSQQGKNTEMLTRSARARLQQRSRSSSRTRRLRSSLLRFAHIFPP